VPVDVSVERFLALDNHGQLWNDQVYRRLLAEFDVRGLDWQTFLDEYVAGFNRHVIGFPGLFDMLAGLQAQGRQLGLISNNCPRSLPGFRQDAIDLAGHNLDKPEPRRLNAKSQRRREFLIFFASLR